jgi:uncharacterized RDD family membrane protein YckC
MSSVKKEEVQHYLSNDYQQRVTLVKTADGDDYELASRGHRFMAYLIDAVIIGIIIQLVQIGTIYAFISAGTKDQLVMNAVVRGIGFIVAAAYWIGLTLKFGATPGKKAIGIRIVNHDNPQRPLTSNQLFMREIVGKILSALILMFGFMMILINKDRRALHDKISGTRVVKFRS